jgi:addiction module HigA family antidote
MAAATQPVVKRPEYAVRRPLKRPAVHPGVLMREILEDHLKLTIAEATRRMGVSRPALYAVLNGTAAVTAEMALRFARLTGGAPDLYLNMQTGYDLEAARQLLDQQPKPLSDEVGLRRSAMPKPERDSVRSPDAQPDLNEPPNTKRWVLRRKAAIIAAVRIGSISIEEALRRYGLTMEEYRCWERSFGRGVTASGRPPRVNLQRPQPSPSGKRGARPK